MTNWVVGKVMMHLCNRRRQFIFGSNRVISIYVVVCHLTADSSIFILKKKKQQQKLNNLAEFWRFNNLTMEDQAVCFHLISLFYFHEGKNVCQACEK